MSVPGRDRIDEHLQILRAELGQFVSNVTLTKPQAFSLIETLVALNAPIPMLLWCPSCGRRHIDRGEFSTKVHTVHSCQNCGLTWCPAIVPTVGVKFLPGFKDEEMPQP